MEASLLVRPDGWAIEEGATKVHGITNEFAAEFGLPLEVVLGIFCGLAAKATLFVGHNLEFDMRVVSTELQRAGWPMINRPQYCTKIRSTNVCKFPPTEKMLKQGRRDYKPPKLGEAYQHAFGETFDGAHDAMADCRATARLYRWLTTSNHPTVTIAQVPGLMKSFEMLSSEEQEELVFSSPIVPLIMTGVLEQFGQPLPPPPPLPPQ